MLKKFQNDFTKWTTKSGVVFKIGDEVSAGKTKGTIERIAKDGEILLHTGKVVSAKSLKHYVNPNPFTKIELPKKEEVIVVEENAEVHTPTSQTKSKRTKDECEREIARLQRELKECHTSDRLPAIVENAPLDVQKRLPEFRAANIQNEIQDAVVILSEKSKDGTSAEVREIRKKIEKNIEELTEVAPQTTLSVSEGCRVTKGKLNGRDTIRIYFNENPPKNVRDQIAKYNFRSYYDIVDGKRDYYWGVFFSQKALDFAEGFCKEENARKIVEKPAIEKKKENTGEIIEVSITSSAMLKKYLHLLIPELKNALSITTERGRYSISHKGSRADADFLNKVIDALGRYKYITTRMDDYQEYKTVPPEITVDNSTGQKYKISVFSPNSGSTSSAEISFYPHSGYDKSAKALIKRDITTVVPGFSAEKSKVDESKPAKERTERTESSKQKDTPAWHQFNSMEVKDVLIRDFPEMKQWLKKIVPELDLKHVSIKKHDDDIANGIDIVYHCSGSDGHFLKKVLASFANELEDDNTPDVEKKQDKHLISKEGKGYKLSFIGRSDGREVRPKFYYTTVVKHDNQTYNSTITIDISDVLQLMKGAPTARREEPKLSVITPNKKESATVIPLEPKPMETKPTPVPETKPEPKSSRDDKGDAILKSLDETLSRIAKAAEARFVNEN